MTKTISLTLDELKQLGIDLKKIVPRKKKKRTKKAVKRNANAVTNDVSFFGRPKVAGGGQAATYYPSAFPPPPVQTTFIKEKVADSTDPHASQLTSIKNDIRNLADKPNETLSRLSLIERDLTNINNQITNNSGFYPQSARSPSPTSSVSSYHGPSVFMKHRESLSNFVDRNKISNVPNALSAIPPTTFRPPDTPDFHSKNYFKPDDTAGIVGSNNVGADGFIELEETPMLPDDYQPQALDFGDEPVDESVPEPVVNKVKSKHKPNDMTFKSPRHYNTRHNKKL